MSLAMNGRQPIRDREAAQNGENPKQENGETAKTSLGAFFLKCQRLYECEYKLAPMSGIRTKVKVKVKVEVKVEVRVNRSITLRISGFEKMIHKVLIVDYQKDFVSLFLVVDAVVY